MIENQNSQVKNSHLEDSQTFISFLKRMDSTKINILDNNNENELTYNARTDILNMRNRAKEQYETSQLAKEQQMKSILRSNGFQEQVQEDRTDKNLRRNYLNSLEYNDQKKFIELYNQNKDL